jgi:hypothetical protein
LAAEVAKSVSSEVENTFSVQHYVPGNHASVTPELVTRVKEALKSIRGFGIGRIIFFFTFRNCIFNIKKEK